MTRRDAAHGLKHRRAATIACVMARVTVSSRPKDAPAVSWLLRLCNCYEQQAASRPLQLQTNHSFSLNPRRGQTNLKTLAKPVASRPSL